MGEGVWKLDREPFPYLQFPYLLSHLPPSGPGPYRACGLLI